MGSSKYKNKKEILAQGVKEFRDSEQSPEDYLNFIAISRIVLQQGSGLVWSEVQEVLEEVLT